MVMIAVERCVNEMEVAMAVVPKRNADRKEDVGLSLVDLGGADPKVVDLNVAAAHAVASFD